MVPAELDHFDGGRASVLSSFREGGIGRLSVWLAAGLGPLLLLLPGGPRSFRVLVAWVLVALAWLVESWFGSSNGIDILVVLGCDRALGCLDIVDWGRRCLMNGLAILVEEAVCKFGRVGAIK